MDVRFVCVFYRTCTWVNIEPRYIVFCKMLVVLGNGDGSTENTRDGFMSWFG